MIEGNKKGCILYIKVTQVLHLTFKDPGHSHPCNEEKLDKWKITFPPGSWTHVRTKLTGQIASPKNCRQVHSEEHK